MLQIEEIMNKFGVVVCCHSDHDNHRFIYDSDILTKYKVSYSYTNHIHFSVRGVFKKFIA